jgi:hypothetical protein
MFFVSNPKGIGGARCLPHARMVATSYPGHRQPPGQLPRSQALSRSVTEVRHVLQRHYLHNPI